MQVVARICADDVAPQRWRNGGGWTRQLLTWPADAHPWQLRISLATIETPGPFSAFPGVRRALALVSGAGLLLTVDGRLHRLQLDSEPLRFDGAAVAHAVPLDGPSIDLNLMTASGRGELLRAAGAGPWSSGCAQRGLYSSVAGTLHADGEPLAVAPNCLLWLRDAAARPLRFVPAVAAPAAAAWWLGYAPPA